jgi:hypothetical protein
MTLQENVLTEPLRDWRAQLIRGALRYSPWLAFVILLAGVLSSRAAAPHIRPIRSDGVGYYIYLPGYLIYRSVDFAAVFEDNPLETLGVGPFTFVTHEPTGRILSITNIGVAIMMLPFFLAAHLFTLVFGFPANGFSFFYQVFMGLAGLIYVVIALDLLKRILLERFSAGVVLAVLASLLLGTSLFHYGSSASIMSHSYSFFLITVLIFITPYWYKNPSWQRSLLLGVLAGMIVLVRIPNGIALLFVVFYGIFSIKDIKERLSFWWKNAWPGIFLVILGGLIIMSLQLIVWKISTGDWLVYAYNEQGFDFKHPQLLAVLFSVRKGVFFWAPILFASMAGLFLLKRKAMDYFLAVVVVLVLEWYLVSSWWSWYFGTSYGHRAFVDYYTFFALPMAAFYDWASRRKRFKQGLGSLACFFFFLTLFQTYQYWIGFLPGDKITLQKYLEIFLRLP